MQPIQPSPKHAAPRVVLAAIAARVSTLQPVDERFDACESRAGHLLIADWIFTGDRVREGFVDQLWTISDVGSALVRLFRIQRRIGTTVFQQRWSVEARCFSPRTEFTVVSECGLKPMRYHLGAVA